MKKLILVFAAIAIAAGAYAQVDSTDRKMDHSDMNKSQDQNELYKSLPDGVLMHNGVVMKVEDGEMTILDDEMTMSNGTIVTSDGNYTKEDGTEMMLEEGEHLDLEGNLTTIKKDKHTSIDLNQEVRSNPAIK